MNKFTAMRAIVNPGDEVILMEPSYVAYTPSVELTGAVPVHIKLANSVRSHPDFQFETLSFPLLPNQNQNKEFVPIQD